MGAQPFYFRPAEIHFPSEPPDLRGRIAPTPTGLLHLGHAATFWTAYQRALGGTLVLRNEDLDPRRCKAEFFRAAIEDLRWLGIAWQEGPDIGGPCAPYQQSERRERFREVMRHLAAKGLIYPSAHSRSDVAEAGLAPHAEEPIFPPAWRPPHAGPVEFREKAGLNWRFRVPDGEEIAFEDRCLGRVVRTALRDFGDFVAWNREDVPAYELAVVVDDMAMGITEVVRGADLLTSTARQLLLYRALGAAPPAFFHCPLLRDEQGRRLAKRHASLSLRELRRRGLSPDEVLAMARRAGMLPV